MGKEIVLQFLTFGFLAAQVNAHCHMLRRGGLSCNEKENIVNMHNYLRQQVALGQVRGQPSASDMLEMVWDEELAIKAQNWADQCPSGHDSNSARSVTRFAVGQNIATTWSSPRPNNYGDYPDFLPQIKAWFDEVYAYSFNSNINSRTGHYSQMVWSDSFLVGCGYSYYHDGSRFVKKYICNYGPGGNIIGHNPYRPGSPTCNIQNSTPSRRFPGLCEISRYYRNTCGYNYGK